MSEHEHKFYPLHMKTNWKPVNVVFAVNVPDAKNSSPLSSDTGEILLEWHDGFSSELHNILMDFLPSSRWWQNCHIPGACLFVEIKVSWVLNTYLCSFQSQKRLWVAIRSVSFLVAFCCIWCHYRGKKKMWIVHVLWLTSLLILKMWTIKISGSLLTGSLNPCFVLVEARSAVCSTAWSGNWKYKRILVSE